MRIKIHVSITRALASALVLPFYIIQAQGKPEAHFLFVPDIPGDPSIADSYAGKIDPNWSIITTQPYKVVRFPQDHTNTLDTLALESAYAQVRNALNQAKNSNDGVVIIGLSHGAGLALRDASTRPTPLYRLKAIIAESPMGIIAETLGKATLNTPILIVHSRNDNVVPINSSRLLYAGLVGAGHKKVYLLELADAKHGAYNQLKHSESATKYLATVHALYRQNNIPYDEKLANRGQRYLKELQPPAERIAKLIYDTSPSLWNTLANFIATGNPSARELLASTLSIIGFEAIRHAFAEFFRPAPPAVPEAPVAPAAPAQPPAPQPPAEQPQALPAAELTSGNWLKQLPFFGEGSLPHAVALPGRPSTISVQPPVPSARETLASALKALPTMGLAASTLIDKTLVDATAALNSRTEPRQSIKKKLEELVQLINTTSKGLENAIQQATSPLTPQEHLDPVIQSTLNQAAANVQRLYWVAQALQVVLDTENALGQVLEGRERGAFLNKSIAILRQFYTNLTASWTSDKNTLLAIVLVLDAEVNRYLKALNNPQIIATLNRRGLTRPLQSLLNEDLKLLQDEFKILELQQEKPGHSSSIRLVEIDGEIKDHVEKASHAFKEIVQQSKQATQVPSLLEKQEEITAELNQLIVQLEAIRNQYQDEVEKIEKQIKRLERSYPEGYQTISSQIKTARQDLRDLIHLEETIKLGLLLIGINNGISKAYTAIAKATQEAQKSLSSRIDALNALNHAIKSYETQIKNAREQAEILRSSYEEGYETISSYLNDAELKLSNLRELQNSLITPEAPPEPQLTSAQEEAAFYHKLQQEYNFDLQALLDKAQKTINDFLTETLSETKVLDMRTLLRGINYLYEAGNITVTSVKNRADRITALGAIMNFADNNQDSLTELREKYFKNATINELIRKQRIHKLNQSIEVLEALKEALARSMAE